MLRHNEIELVSLFQKRRMSVKALESEETKELLRLSVAYVTDFYPNPNSVITNPLSMSEMVSLILLSNGKLIQQCADILSVTYNTVRTYEKRTREKLNTYNRAHSLNIAITKQFLTLRN